MKDLRLLAKKPCISTRRATKMDIVKALPPKGLDELEGKSISPCKNGILVITYFIIA